MRKSTGHVVLIAAVAMAFSSVGTGCKTGGWSMPGASWVSWGKKKPPTASIAGTRDPLQPPSIIVPPHPPGDASSKPDTALASYPSTGTGSATSTAAGSVSNSTQPPAEPTGYVVGPYPTSTAAPAAQQTQQGFYSNSGPLPTATADTRNGNGAFQPSYGAEQPNSTYSAPTGYGATPPTEYGAPTPPYSAPSGYAGTPTGTADASYPVNSAGSTSGGYPAPTTPDAYPGTQYAGAYPTTNDSYDASNQYRPGSTGRNSTLLSPSGGTRMATPTGGTMYPNYYYNR